MCDNRLSTGDKLLACLLVPFYPIILPFWIPFSYYADYRAEKIAEQRRRNDNRSGYDGFQESNNNIEIN